MALIFDPPKINYLDPQPFYPSGTAGQILQSAIESAEAGEPIVMREICRQLDLTPGAPYSHYESSEHLESVVAYTGLLTLAKWMTDSIWWLANSCCRQALSSTSPSTKVTGLPVICSI